MGCNGISTKRNSPYGDGAIETMFGPEMVVSPNVEAGGDPQWDMLRWKFYAVMGKCQRRESLISSVFTDGYTPLIL